jgi:hypothetical protein
MHRETLTRVWQGLFRHVRWNIGIVYAPIATFLESDARPVVSWLPPPKQGKFLADPFGIKINGRLYILCEEFDYRKNRGRIVSIEPERGAPSVNVQPVIELPVHVSYPFLFELRGDIYCIPETRQAREIALYRAKEFPHKWIKSASLISNFSGIDATVFQHDGRWWLSCMSGGSNILSQQFFLFHAQDILGPWKPHSCNPIKTDSRFSRPGGTPFVHARDLYRPSQDCSRGYGGGIILNRVTKLTPTEFEEQPTARVTPDAHGPYPDGLHTLSAVGDVTLIDGMRRRFDYSAFRRNMRLAFHRGM